jgi:hypothetical protein
MSFPEWVFQETGKTWDQYKQDAAVVHMHDLFTRYTIYCAAQDVTPSWSLPVIEM